MVNIGKLYDSERCQLVSIVESGKKETPGVLHFKGLPSAIASGFEVRALENGIVTYAGRCTDPKSRRAARGVVVSVHGRMGVTVHYERLAKALVREGDSVRAGEVIGYEGDTGSGKGRYLAIRFDRNGRLVDGCEYLGIPRKTGMFEYEVENVEETVCKICRLDSQERFGIRSLPCANTIWDKILAAVESKRTI